FRRTDARAVALVLDVVGAKLVAMQEQRPSSTQLDDVLLRQQARAGGLLETLAQQEVAIAVRKVDRNAAIGERANRRGNCLCERIGELIVAEPPIEEITENVDSRCLLRRTACERVKRRERGRSCRREV